MVGFWVLENGVNLMLFQFANTVLVLYSSKCKAERRYKN
nr:MAG TPA: hypothetical protein [Caudoviricetes sp.]